MKLNETHNREVFDRVVDLVASDLYKYAMSISKDRTEAEDALQETFLRVWKSIDQLREMRTAKSWVFTIFRREFARKFERKQHPQISLEEVSEREIPRVFIENNSQYDLYNALNRLRHEYRDPLLLQIIGGFSGEEIASILGISRSNVDTRLFRARNKMRDLLSDNPTQSLRKARE